MSDSVSKFFSKLQNVDNVGDLLGDSLGVFGQAIGSIFDFDGFPSDGQFTAVAITNPVQIKFSEYKALGYVDQDVESDASFYKFKVRIMGNRNNPHLVLEDPCDLTKAEEICQQNGLIASHTTIATSRPADISIGSFLTIKLDKHPNGTFNLQTGHLVETLANNQTGARVLNSDTCQSIRTIFAEGAYEPIATIEVSSDIEYFAKKYDETAEIPYKDNHKKKFAAFNEMGSPFPKYIKALAYIAYSKDKTELFFTGQRSGVRSGDDQKELAKRHEEGDPNVVVASKTPGYHSAGLAADINLMIKFKANVGDDSYGPGLVASQKNAAYKGTKYANRSGNTALWEATNIVKYAKQLGLEWGGDFESYYDPVHFQLTPAGWTRQDVLNAAKQAVANGGKIKYPTATVEGDGDLVEEIEAETEAIKQEELEGIIDDEIAARDRKADFETDAEILGEGSSRDGDFTNTDVVDELGLFEGAEEASEAAAFQRALDEYHREEEAELARVVDIMNEHRENSTVFDPDGDGFDANDAIEFGKRVGRGVRNTSNALDEFVFNGGPIGMLVDRGLREATGYEGE